MAQGVTFGATGLLNCKQMAIFTWSEAQMMTQCTVLQPRIKLMAFMAMT